LEDSLVLEFLKVFKESPVKRALFLIFASMRPKQWIKNILVFVALIFSKNVFDIAMLAATAGAFIVFCFVSSGIYILNDLLDIEKDKKHPVKRQRPLASGELSPLLAKVIVLTILSGCLIVSFLINLAFAITVLGYIVLQICYSKFAKEIVVLDVFFIATGFFLRVIAGAVVIEVPISSWLLICTIFVSLFLGLGKRRHEILLLGAEAVNHRRALAEYNLTLLDQMVSIVTAGTVISYSLYTLSPETVSKFHTDKLWLTIPIVLYGVFRYLYVIYKGGKGGHPELVFFEDRHILASILLYILVVGLIIYL
jgi:4-hydroxybenzoate polyprenyltransferase